MCRETQRPYALGFKAGQAWNLLLYGKMHSYKTVENKVGVWILEVGATECASLRICFFVVGACSKVKGRPDLP